MRFTWYGRVARDAKTTQEYANIPVYVYRYTLIGLSLVNEMGWRLK